MMVLSNVNNCFRVNILLPSINFPKCVHILMYNFITYFECRVMNEFNVDVFIRKVSSLFILRL